MQHVRLATPCCALPDALSCRRATAAIITKDEDFAQRRALTEKGPIVVWIRLPNARRKELLAWFDKAMPAILTALENGDTLIEVT